MSPTLPVQQSDSQILFAPFDLRGLRLANRVVMAPLTRSRATHGTGAPNALNATYYAQRATAGLIVSEATNISPAGKGYAWTPGIYTAEQIAGWRLVTDAVHGRGGRITMQLWHVGRISHPSLQPGGQLPVAPSAVRPLGRAFTEAGYQDLVTPRALGIEELPGIVEDYRRAAGNAIAAGCDGVEIHAANGYLLDQFLRDGANRRTDAYGGSVPNRLRFPLEVVAAVADEIGPGRVGIRLSPISTVNDLSDSDPAAVFFPLVRELDRFGLAYVHVIEGVTQGPRDNIPFDFAGLRQLFDGPWMANNGYTREMAIEALAGGYADLVAFGRPFIANPDLVERFRRNAALNDVDYDRLFGGGAEGYTDYPTLDARPAAADTADISIPVRVECYAGHRGEETPRRFYFGEREIAVSEVADQWLAPDHRYFKVKGADGAVYILRHDIGANLWELIMFERGAQGARGAEAIAQ